MIVIHFVELSEFLAMGLRPQEKLTLNNLQLEVNVPAERCDTANFLLVGVIITAPSVNETMVDNNFRIIPLDMVCEGVYSCLG